MVRVKQTINKKQQEETINKEKKEKLLKTKRDKYKSESSAKKMENVRFARRYLVLDEIKYYQSTTDCLILKKPFQRLVKEILQDVEMGKNCPLHRMSCKAICILQEVAETHLVNLMNDSVLCAMHTKRITVFPKDFQLVLRLNPQY